MSTYHMRSGAKMHYDSAKRQVRVVNPNGIVYFAQYSGHLTGSALWLLGRFQSEVSLILRGWKIIK